MPRYPHGERDDSSQHEDFATTHQDKSELQQYDQDRTAVVTALASIALIGIGYAVAEMRKRRRS